MNSETKMWASFLIIWLMFLSMVALLVLTGHSGWWALILLIPANMKFKSEDGKNEHS